MFQALNQHTMVEQSSAHYACIHASATVTDTEYKNKACNNTNNRTRKLAEKEARDRRWVNSEHKQGSQQQQPQKKKLAEKEARDGDPDRFKTNTTLIFNINLTLSVQHKLRPPTTNTHQQRTNSYTAQKQTITSTLTCLQVECFSRPWRQQTRT